MKLYLSYLKGVLGLTTTILAGFAANAITVQEVGVNPAETPTITTAIDGQGTVTVRVYAGVNQLVVDGVPMNGFCIDPFHYSLSSSSGYSYVPLTSAPKGHAMTSAIASEIALLWGAYYSPALSSSSTAAGLQIAIWELVGGSSFALSPTTANDYGASAMRGVVEASGYNGPSANLIALTGPGQDYVVSTPVRDSGATVLLFGFALFALFVVNQRATVKRCA